MRIYRVRASVGFQCLPVCHAVIIVFGTIMVRAGFEPVNYDSSGFQTWHILWRDVFELEMFCIAIQMVSFA